MAKSLPITSWTEFLADVAPGSTYTVTELMVPLEPDRMVAPVLEYYCPQCNGWRQSQATGAIGLDMHQERAFKLTFLCFDCKTYVKEIYGKAVLDSPQGRVGTASKIGEWPPFAVRVLSKLRPLLGDDYTIFQKGRLAESMGLGIGAFGYYRRIVERQKNRLLERVKQVAQRTGNTSIIPTLERAIAETQFKRAMNDVKDAVPDSLRIKGENPLTLLHAALSEGIHNETDENCLEMARHIRTVLGEFAAKADEALKVDAAIEEAVYRLRDRKGLPAELPPTGE